MDRRTILAVVLSFGVFFAWQKLYLEPRTAQQRAQHAAEVAHHSEADASLPNQKKEAAQIDASTLKPLKVETLNLSGSVASVSNASEWIQTWTLNEYKKTLGDEGPAVSLEDLILKSGAIEVSFNRQEFLYLKDVRGTLSKEGDAALWSYSDSRIQMVRRIEIEPTLENTLFAKVDITIKDPTLQPAYAFLGVRSQSVKDDAEARDRSLAVWTQDSIERYVLQTDDFDTESVRTPVSWIAALNRYFVLALVPQGSPLPGGRVQPWGDGLNKGWAGLVYPMSGPTLSIPVRIYFGPKDLNQMEAVHPTLGSTADFGWFTPFAYALLWIMKKLYAFFGNYGIAIILLTILVRSVTFPLTYKSTKSMKKLSAVQPKLQKIREQYKDDKEALQRETMKAMKQSGANPLAGCLPILIQMPVFFALYRVLYSSVELYQEPFFGWIMDLSQKDPFYVTPILMTATMFFQQKLTPSTAADPTQQRILQFMPLIFGVIMINLPSGLALYMLTNALTGILQQLVLNRKLGIKPNAT